MSEEAVKIVLDAEALTLGDLEDFEDFVGQDLFAVIPTTEEQAAEFKPSAKVLTGIVWIVKRAENPDFTIEDARHTKIADLDLKFGEEPDPTPAAG